MSHWYTHCCSETWAPQHLKSFAACLFSSLPRLTSKRKKTNFRISGHVLAEFTDEPMTITTGHRRGIYIHVLFTKKPIPILQCCFTRARPQFYQTRSAWSMDQGSNENHSPVNSFAPTVTKYCVMWEGQALPHDTKFGNCRDKIVDSRAFLSWSLIHGSSWSGLIKVGPGQS